MIDEQFTAEELILRDHLALDRTRLANERTLLAYLRTALMLHGRRCDGREVSWAAA